LILTAANNVNSITAQSAWVGRKMTLVSVGTVDVFDLNNLIIAGTWNATAGDTLSLVCDGVNWYETSRSNNA